MLFRRSILKAYLFKINYDVNIKYGYDKFEAGQSNSHPSNSHPSARARVHCIEAYTIFRQDMAAVPCSVSRCREQRSCRTTRFKIIEKPLQVNSVVRAIDSGGICRQTFPRRNRFADGDKKRAPLP